MLFHEPYSGIQTFLENIYLNPNVEWNTDGSTSRPDVDYTGQPNAEKRMWKIHHVLTGYIPVFLTWKIPIQPNLEYTSRPNMESAFWPNIKNSRLT